MLTNLGKDLNHLVDLSLLNENSLIVDGGACVGRFVNKMRELGVISKFICIEPVPNNILKLKRIDNIIIENKALVGIKVDSVSFIETPGLEEWGSTNPINSQHALKRGVGSVVYDVGTITLQEIIDKYGVIDYLKMDIEGNEVDVVENLPNNIKQISMEVHHYDLNLLSDKLSSIGYKTYFLDNELYGVL